MVKDENRNEKAALGPYRAGRSRAPQALPDRSVGHPDVGSLGKHEAVALVQPRLASPGKRRRVRGHLRTILRW